MSKKPSLFSELNRRNVFRVALTYAVVAWLLVEIAGVVLPMLGAPEWLITTLVVLLAIGFALSMFISWSFEMTPEGLKRTEELSPDQVLPYWSRRKFATFIIGTAVIAFGLSAYQLLMPKQPATYSRNEPGSVLVQPTPGVTSETMSDRQSTERILRDLHAQTSAAVAAKDLDKLLSFYSEDAVVFPPNAPAARTKDAIRNLWKELLASVDSISSKTTKVEVAKSGEMAYVTGTYELTLKNPTGNPVQDHGKNLVVWEKQPDGHWKCRADMWNTNLPVSEPAPAEKK